MFGQVGVPPRQCPLKRSVLGERRTQALPSRKKTSKHVHTRLAGAVVPVGRIARRCALKLTFGARQTHLLSKRSLQVQTSFAPNVNFNYERLATCPTRSIVGADGVCTCTGLLLLFGKTCACLYPFHWTLLRTELLSRKFQTKGEDQFIL